MKIPERDYRETRDYEVFPKILRSGSCSKITIRPLGKHAAFKMNTHYLVAFIPMEESIEHNGAWQDFSLYCQITVEPENGCLSFEHTFEGEQEHYIKVFQLPLAAEHPEEHPIGTFHVYSLFEDLYSKKPLRGDMHCHTMESDGAQDPGIVAANYRKKGFDFVSITDHHRWYPSDQAIKAYQDIQMNFKIIHGEEVHAFDNHIHIINFGGKASVNEMFEKNKDKYFEEVNALVEQLSVPEGVHAFEYASCCWVFNKIREVGGMGIFAHPFWIPGAYHVQMKMVDYLFKTMPFDAFELLGGHEVECNNLQVAYYNEARANGLKIPVVGSSDAHNDTTYFNWFSTIVFADSSEPEAITEAVKNLYSVAVESYPDEGNRVYGPFRMVKYAIFLLQEYFPVHDELCFEEGRLMKAYIGGDQKAADELNRIGGRTSELLALCFQGR